MAPPKKDKAKTKSKAKHQASKSMPTAAAATTDEESPIYFWRQTEEPYGVFSQWAPTPFEDPEKPGIVFETAEQYMMYGKALLFSTAEHRTTQAILETSDPREQKALGHQIPNFSDAVWNEHRLKIVERGNLLKFTRDTDGEDIRRKEVLMGTGEREIVEASPYDRIWGIGLSAKDAARANRGKWGMNLLGVALMRVRAHLSKEEEKEDQEKKEISEEDMAATF